MARYKSTEPERIKGLEDKICVLDKNLEILAGEIEDELREAGIRDIDTLKIVRIATEMTGTQQRLFALEEWHAALMRGEEKGR